MYNAFLMDLPVSSFVCHSSLLTVDLVLACDERQPHNDCDENMYNKNRDVKLQSACGHGKVKQKQDLTTLIAIKLSNLYTILYSFLPDNFFERQLNWQRQQHP